MKIDLLQADNSRFLGVNDPCGAILKVLANKIAIFEFAIQTPQHLTIVPNI